MSNYLRGIGRVVGFTDDTARGGALGEQGDAESWDAVSRMSSRGDQQPQGGKGTGTGAPPRWGARTPAGDNYPIASPTHRERQQQWEGWDNIPRAIMHIRSSQQDDIDGVAGPVLLCPSS